MGRLPAGYAFFAAAFVIVGSITGAHAVERIRGTVKSVDGDVLKITSIDGIDVPLKLESTTNFASVVPATLADIKPGTFIGTATKEMDDRAVSLEIVVFPESMRGRGEGHYAWDMLPDTAKGSGSPVQSTMTEGTVGAAKGPRVKSMMTNGTVSSAAQKGGTIELEVTYSGGKSIAISVPANVPVVTFAPADRNALIPGAKVFAVAEGEAGKMVAKAVNVGKDGLTPPM